MKKVMLLMLLAVFLIISSAGLAQANGGCSSYLVDVRESDGSMYQDCMEFCDDGSYVSFYSYEFGNMYGSYGSLGSDKKTIMLWGDGYEGIPAAFFFELKGSNLIRGQGGMS